MTTLIEVRSDKRTDSMEVLVERAIRSQAGGLIRSLKVESDGSCLVVRGLTDLYYHKQLATRAAMETTGDIMLINEIEVCSH